MGVKLTARLHLGPKLKISGTTPPLSLYATIAWIKKTLPLHTILLVLLISYLVTHLWGKAIPL